MTAPQLWGFEMWGMMRAKGEEDVAEGREIDQQETERPLNLWQK